MPKIGGGGGNGLCETGFVFLYMCFEHRLECSEMDVSDGVLFFGTLVRGVEAEITTMSLHSSLDEELELGGVFYFCLVSRYSQWVDFFKFLSFQLYQIIE